MLPPVCCTCPVKDMPAGILSQEALPWRGRGAGRPEVGTSGDPRSQTHLPEQHGQQQEDEDPHQQTDGDDPPHDVATGLQVVQGLEHHLGGKGSESESASRWEWPWQDGAQPGLGVN